MLPIELLEEIFDEFALISPKRASTWLSLLFCSKTFYTFILPRLYHTITANQFASEKLAQILSEKPQRNSFVKDLDWCITMDLYPETDTNAGACLCSPSKHEARLNATLAVLSNFTNLQMLAIGCGLNFLPADTATTTGLFYLESLPFLPSEQQLALHPIPAVTSLKVDFAVQYEEGQRGMGYSAQQHCNILNSLMRRHTTRTLTLLSANFRNLSPFTIQYPGLRSLVIRDISNDVEDDHRVGEFIKSCPGLTHLVLELGLADPISLVHLGASLLSNGPLPSLLYLELFGAILAEEPPPAFKSICPIVSSLKLWLTNSQSPAALRSIFPPNDPSNLRWIWLNWAEAYIYLTGEYLSLQTILGVFCDRSTFPLLERCSVECLAVDHLGGWNDYLALLEELNKGDLFQLIYQTIIDDFEGIQVSSTSSLELSCNFLREEQDPTGLKEVRRVGAGEVEVSWWTADDAAIES